LRINGSDTGNTLYNDTIQLGLTALNNTIFNTGTSLANYPTRMTIDTFGRVGINITNQSSVLTINDLVSDRGGYNDSQAPLTVTHQTPTTNIFLNDPLSVLHLCRQGRGGVVYGARATFKLYRYEDPGNVWSRTRLDLVLADTTYADVSVMIFKSNGFVGIGIVPNYLFHVANITVSTLVTNAST
jgi:hypothetical protein